MHPASSHAAQRSALVEQAQSAARVLRDLIALSEDEGAHSHTLSAPPVEFHGFVRVLEHWTRQLAAPPAGRSVALYLDQAEDVAYWLDRLDELLRSRALERDAVELLNGGATVPESEIDGTQDRMAEEIGQLSVSIRRRLQQGAP